MSIGNPEAVLPTYWPLSSQHTISHVQLDAAPPAPEAQVLPHLLQLARKSDALRSLQTAGGRFASESAAQALLRDMAEEMHELADAVDEASAEAIRIRARALGGEVSFRQASLEVARLGAAPPLEVICGPLCTWRSKTDQPLHSFLAAVRHQPSAALIDALDGALQGAVDELRDRLGAPTVDVSCVCPLHVTDLIVSAGEAGGHPKHFAYFLPEDEGIDRAPFREQRTVSFRNVQLARFAHITAPLAALLDGPRRAEDLPFEVTLPTWLRGHDLGHNVAVPETNYDWMQRLGVEPFMMLQEAVADVYGFLLSLSDSWLRVTEVSPLDVCATHLSELLHYMRRGPWYRGDAGAAYLQLSFLAANGFVEISRGGVVSWTAERVVEGFAELGRTLLTAILSVDHQSRASDLIDRYGWPSATPALQTLAALRWNLAKVPTSIAFYRDPSLNGARPAGNGARPFEDELECGLVPVGEAHGRRPEGKTLVKRSAAPPPG
jgi:hypothetical protein